MPNLPTPRELRSTRRHEPVADLPDDFRYPVGYFEPKNRQREPEQFAKFDPLLHPYLILNKTGETVLDSRAPRAAYNIRNTLKGHDDGLLKSAIRFLELGSEPDAPMQAAYQQEDRLEWAQVLTDAGHHGAALKIVDSLNETHQQIPSAAKVRVNALHALGRFEEALIYADTMLEAKPEDNAYRWAENCLTKAELLLLTGQVDATAQLLDQKRNELLSHYRYYGIRAGIALAQGDRATARQFVQRAAQCDCHQCYKLLWLRSLEPILNWLAAELLTEDGASLAATEDGELRLLANRIQCLAIRGHNTEARALAQRVYEDVFAGQNFYNYRR